MIGIYSVGMGTGASLSAGLTIPLQHVLKGSLNMALAFWGALTIIAIMFWYPVMKRKKKTSTQNKKNNKLPLRNKKHGYLQSFSGYNQESFIPLRLGLRRQIKVWV